MHIDNGGISLDIHDDEGYISIELDTTYHGHPSVSTCLSGFLTKEQLTELGTTLIEAASKI